MPAVEGHPVRSPQLVHRPNMPHAPTLALALFVLLFMLLFKTCPNPFLLKRQHPIATGSIYTASPALQVNYANRRTPCHPPHRQAEYHVPIFFTGDRTSNRCMHCAPAVCPVTAKKPDVAHRTTLQLITPTSNSYTPDLPCHPI